MMAQLISKPTNSMKYKKSMTNANVIMPYIMDIS